LGGLGPLVLLVHFEAKLLPISQFLALGGLDGVVASAPHWPAERYARKGSGLRVMHADRDRDGERWR
jgi:hypothetical protein